MNAEAPVITRLAIVICCPGSEDNFLPGSLNDPIHITRYLKSPRGGMWKANEIFCLTDPKWEDVRLILTLFKTDYLFVYYSGHGCMDKFERRYFCLRNAMVEDTAFFKDCPRQLIVSDTCRTYFPTISGITPDEEDIYAYIPDPIVRAVFDNAIRNSPAGRLIVHSTKAGMEAYESNVKGGAFTIALLSTAKSYNS
jgi:hypothetical protein